MNGADRGSTTPMILGFALMSMLCVAGSIVAGQVFVQQVNLQGACDGAATAAVAVGVELNRALALGSGPAQLSNVQGGVDEYLAQTHLAGTVVGAAVLVDDSRRLMLKCTVKTHIWLGSLFGYQGGIGHTAWSGAEASSP